MSRSNILRTEGPRRITPAPTSDSKGNNVKDTHALKARGVGIGLNLIPPPPEALNLLRRISGRTQEDDQAHTRACDHSLHTTNHKPNIPSTFTCFRRFVTFA